MKMFPTSIGSLCGSLCTVLALFLGGCMDGTDGEDVGSNESAVRPRAVGIQEFSSVANVTIDGPPIVETCVGADGLEYTVTSITGSGPFESEELGDGTFYADARLLHGPDGRGIGFDNVLVLNEDGTEKLRGLAKSPDPTPGKAIVAMVEFRLPDGRRGIAQTEVTLPPPPPAPQVIHVVYGGGGTPQTPQLGFVVSGDCARFMFEWRHARF